MPETDQTTPRARTQAQTDELLREIRDRYDYAQAEWRDIKEEGKTDIRYVAGEPWSDKDKRAREAAARPCLALDELGQYVNQLINDIRQNKRAIQVTPQGMGAKDEEAEIRANLIRQIEYRSNAQQAYTTMFENAVQRSYGYLRIRPRYVDDRSFDQELLIEPIVNPDLVTIDPDSIRPDGADMQYAFIEESLSREEFKRRWPTAKIQSFSPEHEKAAPGWIGDRRIRIAEYWTIEHGQTRELLLIRTVQNGQPGEVAVWADELEQQPSDANILRRREVSVPVVKQYLTNGVEILSETTWPGKSIPIVPCYGKVLYVDDGAGAKRRILSLIRLARDPYMLYCYYRTCEAELVGMTPKFPYFVYEGQLSAIEQANLEKSLHEPVAVIKVRPTIDGLPPGNGPLPYPQRQPYDPPIQALEFGAEAARRAIQAAMGISPLPTQAQRQNEKSGVALQRIEESGQKGSFHFVDHYEASLTRCGALLNELLPHYYDSVRDVTLRKPDDTTERVQLNGSAEHQITPDGSFDVTISTGPSYESERELANQFADILVQTPLVAQVAGPKVAAAILGLAIKLKNLGPLGDEMADLITPPEYKQAQESQIPPEVIAQMGQMQQMLQEAQRAIEIDAAKQQATIQKAELDAQTDLQKAQIDQETKIRIAEIEANTKFGVEQLKAGLDDFKARLAHIETLLGHHAEAAKLQSEQAHDAAQLERNREIEDERAEADRQFQRETGDAQRAHEATLAERQAQQQQGAD